MIDNCHLWQRLGASAEVGSRSLKLTVSTVDHEGFQKVARQSSLIRLMHISDG